MLKIISGIRQTKGQMLLFCGGSGCKELVHHLSPKKLIVAVPGTDDGGSTGVIHRLIPLYASYGDARSTILNLAPDSKIKQVLNTRLSDDPSEAANEVEHYKNSSDDVYQNIVPDKRLVLAFFMLCACISIKHFNRENTFTYAAANVGNLFLLGIKLFYLLSQQGPMLAAPKLPIHSGISRQIPLNFIHSPLEIFSKFVGLTPKYQVICSTFHNVSHTLRATLEDGTEINGQNMISHPPSDHNPAKVDKTFDVPLPEKIKHLNIINYSNVPITVQTPKALVNAIRNSPIIIYGMGSFFTSILASLLGNSTLSEIANNTVSRKLFISNAYPDRESGTMRVEDFLIALTAHAPPGTRIQQLVTDVVIPETCQINYDPTWFYSNSITIHKVENIPDAQYPKYNAEALGIFIKEFADYEPQVN